MDYQPLFFVHELWVNGFARDRVRARILQTYMYRAHIVELPRQGHRFVKGIRVGSCKLPHLHPFPRDLDLGLGRVDLDVKHDR